MTITEWKETCGSYVDDAMDELLQWNIALPRSQFNEELLYKKDNELLEKAKLRCKEEYPLEWKHWGWID